MIFAFMVLSLLAIWVNNVYVDRLRDDTMEHMREMEKELESLRHCVKVHNHFFEEVFKHDEQ